MIQKSELVKNAVQAFLKSQIDKKTEKEQTQLDKAKEDNDYAKISELSEKIAEVKAKFTKEKWLFNASDKMAKQLNFGTHISKGVHPDAKGDNISFQPTKEQIASLPSHVIGSHSINSDFIDANGNAAALPLASFFDFQVNDCQLNDSQDTQANEVIKIKHLILEDNQEFIDTLSADSEQAKQFHQSFKSALLNHIENPISHERNKQTLWAMNAYGANNTEQLHYTAIVPLYPSVFTFEIYQKINDLRYSEKNKSARDNRFKKTAEQLPYVSLLDLATLHLGGTKPQNVSMLMSKQGGRNYLLPSLPPPSITKNLDAQKDKYHYRPSKFTKSIFDGKQLAYQCKKDIKRIFNVVKDTRNIVDVRDQRKQALDEVLQNIFCFANYMRTQLPAGWTKDTKLLMHQKLWLDPMRADLEGEEDFAKQRMQDDWIKKIIDDFANWMKALLKDKFPEYKADIADPEHFELEREIEDMKKQYERAGKGVFL